MTTIILNSHFLDFPAVSNQNRSAIEFIRHACLGQSPFWNIFGTFFTEEELFQKFSDLLSSKPPTQYSTNEYCPHPIFFRVDLYNFINGKTKKANLDLTSYFLLELKKLNKKWSEELYPYVSNPQKPAEKYIKQIFENIQHFLRKEQPLLYALEPNITQLLKLIGPKRFMSELGLETFEIVNTIDPSYLEFFQPSSINATNIAEFLQFPSFIKDEKMTKVFQSLFECGEPFPTSSKLFKENNVLTLTNDVIIKHKNFFDILYMKANSSFLADNTTKLANITESFPELNPWLVLTNYEYLVNDRVHFDTLIAQYSNNDMCYNIFERFSNDNAIINQIALFLGMKISPDDLANKSIPFIIVPAIDNVEDEILDKFMNGKLIILSDKEREYDISILYGYKCYQSVLEHFDPVKLNHYLSKIKSPEILATLILDLFSLLFLPELNLSLEDAKLLITAIMPFASPKEYEVISRGLSRLQFGQYLGFTTFSECLYSQEEALVKCLQAKLYELCEKTVAGNNKLVKICQAAQALDFLRTNSTATLKEPNDVFEIEKNFSYQISSEISTSDNSLKRIYESRKSKTPLQILSLFENSSVLNEVIKTANKSMNEKEYVEKIPEKFTQLHQFYSMLLLMKEHNCKSPAGMFADMKDSNMITKMLGPNSIERLLLTQDSMELLPYLESEFPLVAKCMKMQDIQKTNKTKDEDVLDSLDAKVDEKMFIQEISEAVKSNDISMLIDLRLKDQNLFDKQKIKVSLPDFINIYPDKSSKSLGTVVELGITDMDSKIIIDKLFEKKEYMLAKTISQEFSDVDYFIDKMTESVKSDPFCLKKYGEMAFNILNLLPTEICTTSLKNATLGVDIKSISVESLAKKLTGLDIDDELYSKLSVQLQEDITKTLEKVQSKFKFAVSYAEILAVEESISRIALFKKKQHIQRLLCEAVLNAVSTLKFNSVETERETIRIMTKACRVLNKVKVEISKSEAFVYEKQASQLSALTKIFTEHILYGRYSIPVELSYFNTLAFVDDLSQKCILKDVDIIDDIKGPWKYVSSLALLSRSVTSFLIGDSKECWDCISRQKVLGGHLSSNQIQIAVRDLSFPYLFFITPTQNNDPYLSMLLGSNSKMLVSANDKNWKMRSSFADTIPNKPHGIALRSIYERVKSILDGVDINIMLKEQALALNDIILTFFGPAEHAAFCSGCGMFESALESYDLLPATLKNANVALKTIFAPAIANLQWKKLLRLLDDVAKHVNVEQVADFLWQKGMSEFSLSLLTKLRKFEKAVNYRVQILPTRDSWQSKLVDLKFIVDTIVSEINFRSSNPTAEFSIPNTQLTKMSAVAGIEHMFVQMCIDENIPYQNIDLIGGKRSDALQMAVMSILHGRFHLLLGICDCYAGLIDDSMKMAIDKMSDSGRHPEKIPLFLELLSKKVDAKTYYKIAKVFVLTVASRAADMNAMSKFIKTHVKGISLQVELLLILKFGSEALSTAVRGGNDDIAKVIEYAEVNGDEMLYSAAQRALRRN